MAQKAKKRRDKGTMTAKAYPIFCRALEEGIRLGYTRAFKHTDKPSREEIEDHIASAVLAEVADVFDFGDDLE